MRGARPRILGLSLLAAVGVMAVSASAAQGKWLLLKNGQSVMSHQHNIVMPDIELLVPALGSAMYCEEGEGAMEGGLSGESKKLTGNMVIELTGCTELELGEVCTVRSVGQPVGTVVLEASIEASMQGEKVYLSASSSEFTSILPEGAECPLVEVNCVASGSMQVEVLEPLKEAALHLAHFISQNIQFGELPAEVHDAGAGTPSGSVTEVSSAPWSIHLVGL